MHRHRLRPDEGLLQRGAGPRLGEGQLGVLVQVPPQRQQRVAFGVREGVEDLSRHPGQDELGYVVGHGLPAPEFAPHADGARQ
ncbi:MAG: hypothetical protein ACK55I_37200, partial [bacterium]